MSAAAASIQLGVSQSLLTSERTAPSEWRELAGYAEAAGIGLVGMADVMTRNYEMTVGLTALALSTKRIRIASTVSNPLTRHPAVTAAAFASLQKLSGGRMVFGIGTGDSGVRNVGLAPASLADLARFVAAFRALLASGRATFREQQCNVPWAPSAAPVPIFLSAEGPRSLRLAGAIADGVLTGRGVTPVVVRATLAHIEQGAREAGRDPRDVEVWFHAPVAVREDPREAERDVIGDVVSAVRMPGWSPLLEEGAVGVEARKAILKLRERYDIAHHAAADSANMRLAAELGLTDLLIGSLALAGTVETVARRLCELRDAGLRNLYVASAAPEPRQLLDGLVAARRLADATAL